MSQHGFNEYGETDLERVSTEPQRRALDAMSEDLVRKLNAMVAEQEARARDFAAHQHSLSSLPQLNQELPQVSVPQVEQTPLKGLLKQQRPQKQGGITNGPRPATKQQQLPPAEPIYDYPPVDWDEEGHNQPAQEEKKEAGISAGTIIFIIFVLFFILRSCS